jgi:chromosome segregation ATPase
MSEKVNLVPVTCGTCNGDLHEDGQWLRCRAHFTRDIAALRRDYLALADAISVESTGVADLVAKVHLLRETATNCRANMFEAERQLDEARTNGEKWRESMYALESRVMQLTEALREIALFGHTRPLVCGEGDDGDGHWKRIAQTTCGIAARAVLK